MLKFIDTISDKPEWWRKVKDTEITSKWRRETLEMDWPSLVRWGDFTPAMIDAVCIFEKRILGCEPVTERCGF